MMLRTSRMVPLVGLLFVVVACSKQSATNAADRIPVPALYAHVPADTPYVLGSFEPMPDFVFEWAGVGYGTLLKQVRQQPELAKLITIFEQELGGQWNRQGLESLGFSTKARFALYGLGLYPVLRM